MSSHVERSDIPDIATLLVTLGARLGQETTRDGKQMPVGEAAWWASLDYQPGPRAANTDPGGGNRWETDETSGEVQPVPNDATGETATSHDPTSLTHARYRALLGWLQDNADDLRNLLSTLLPPQPNTKVVNCDGCGAPKPVDAHKPQDLDALAAAGWCRSCFRVDGHLERITTDRNGARRYASLCRWCGDFRAGHGALEPPLAILRARLQGRRITPADVEKHCPHCKGEGERNGQRRGRRGWVRA